MTPALSWVAGRVYEFLPALGSLPGAQVPILAANATVGVLFFVFTIPFSYWLAGVFACAGYASLDRETTQLKRFREKRKNYKRNHEDFWMAEQPNPLIRSDL